MRSLPVIAVSVLFAGILAHADPALDEGYRQMYDLRFDEAHATFQHFEQLHPNDPMGPVSDAAAYLFSEFDRLHILQSEFFTHDQHWVSDHKLEPDQSVKQKFDAALESSRQLASRTPNDENSEFATILRIGLRSDYLALIEKRYMASLQEMKSARAMAQNLIAKNPTFYDAWLAIGVENYTLSTKPAPVRWFLRMSGAQTDRSLGIEKLKLTAEKGHYLAPFARLMLAVAALRDNNKDQARELLAGLCHDYPHNPLYREELQRLNPTIARREPAQ
jgi:hypothetical protein